MASRGSAVASHRTPRPSSPRSPQRFAAEQMIALPQRGNEVSALLQPRACTFTPAFSVTRRPAAADLSRVGSSCYRALQAIEQTSTPREPRLHTVSISPERVRPASARLAQKSTSHSKPATGWPSSARCTMTIPEGCRPFSATQGAASSSSTNPLLGFRPVSPQRRSATTSVVQAGSTPCLPPHSENDVPFAWDEHTLEDGLRLVPPLLELASHTIKRLALHSRLITLKRYGELWRRKAPMHAFYVLLKGEVRIDAHDGCSRLVRAEEWLAEGAWVENAVHMDTALATQQCLVCCVDLRTARVDDALTDAIARIRRKMGMEWMAALLATVPIFCDIGSAMIRKIAPTFKVKQVQPGELVFQQGDIGTDMYVLVLGAVSIEFHQDIPSQRNSSGRDEGLVTQVALLTDESKSTFFGEMALIARKPRSASARSIERTMLLELSEKSVWHVLFIMHTRYGCMYFHGWTHTAEHFESFNVDLPDFAARVKMLHDMREEANSFTSSGAASAARLRPRGLPGAPSPPRQQPQQAASPQPATQDGTEASTPRCSPQLLNARVLAQPNGAHSARAPTRPSPRPSSAQASSVTAGPFVELQAVTEAPDIPRKSEGDEAWRVTTWLRELKKELPFDQSKHSAASHTKERRLSPRAESTVPVTTRGQKIAARDRVRALRNAPPSSARRAAPREQRREKQPAVKGLCRYGFQHTTLPDEASKVMARARASAVRANLVQALPSSAKQVDASTGFGGISAASAYKAPSSQKFQTARPAAVTYDYHLRSK